MEACAVAAAVTLEAFLEDVGVLDVVGLGARL